MDMNGTIHGKVASVSPAPAYTTSMMDGKKYFHVVIDVDRAPVVTGKKTLVDVSRELGWLSSWKHPQLSARFYYPNERKIVPGRPIEVTGSIHVEENGDYRVTGIESIKLA